MKYEYGPGRYPEGGYITVDMTETADIKLWDKDDVFKPVCGEGEADEIFSNHFIEHFERVYVEKLVKNWYKMLKPGGKLITCFPDFTKMSHDSLDNKYWLADEARVCRLFQHIFGERMPNDPSNLYKHRSMWTGLEFELLLEDIGFTHIEIMDYDRRPHINEWTTEIHGAKP